MTPPLVPLLLQAQARIASPGSGVVAHAGTAPPDSPFLAAFEGALRMEPATGSHGTTAPDAATPSPPDVQVAECHDVRTMTAPEALLPSVPAIEQALTSQVPAAMLPLAHPARLSSGGAPPPAAPPRAEQLDPVFRNRLDRVIDRMATEFGYRVEIVELVRSQTRQDALYSSGRETPGPIVTWTRSSRHTEGRAADVLIDGSYANTGAYQKLAEVARQEGLRTLGARDPGHLELGSRGTFVPESRVAATAHPGAVPDRQPISPGAARHEPAFDPSRSFASAMPATAFAPPPLAVVRPETVARVAPVARVAEVGQVAVPGSSAASGVDLAAGPSLAPQGAPAVSATSPAMPTWQSAGGRQPSGHDAPTEHEPHEPQAAPPVEKAQGQFVAFGTRPDEPAADLLTTPEFSASSAVDRVAHVLELRDAAAERPLTSLLLRLEHPSGAEDRVRIDARGLSVSAAMDIADHQLADDLGRRVAELAGSMKQQGLEPELLTVRAATRDANAVPQALAGEADARRAALSTATAGGSSTSRDPRGSPSRQDHTNSDSPRDRPRRDARGDR